MFDNDMYLGLRESEEEEEGERDLESDDAVGRKLFMEAAQDKVERKQDVHRNPDAHRETEETKLEDQAKKFASKLAHGELSKADEREFRTAVKEAYLSGRLDAFNKFINESLVELKSKFQLSLSKENAFNVDVILKDKDSGREAWKIDVLVVDVSIG